MSTIPEKAQKLIDEFAANPDIKAMVSHIESSIATTQHHYGDYGAALHKLSGGRKGVAQLLALAMIKAGGNQEGVLNGLKHFVTG